MPTDVLRQELGNLLTGFDRSREHVVITDAAGVIVYANAGAERHTGYRRQEMLGRKPGDLWGGQMTREFYEEMWRTIRDQKQAYLGEVRNRKKDGEFYWQEVHIIPVLNAEGGVRWFIGIELEIDEQRRREALMRADAGDLGRAGAPVRVRWPLGWVLESGSLSEGQLRELREYYGEGNAIDQLTGDLLALSSLPHRARAPAALFCVDTLLQDVLRQVREAVPNRRYRLNSRGGPHVIRENNTLLGELLVRVVTNAAQYTCPDGGEVLLVLLRTGNQCVVRCEDNGIGISLLEQRHIFDKFYRGARARALHPGGSGLGLYLAKAIAAARGWEVSCTSAPGLGAQFEVRIPLQGPAKDPGEPG